MTTCASTAAATGLPAFLPSVIPPTPRRGFLAGLAALPMLSGTFSGLGAKPPGRPDGDKPAELDDYAAAEFEALEVDLAKARAAHANMWTPLAMSLQMMTKTPDECRDFAAAFKDDYEPVEHMMEALNDGASWYRQAAEILEAARLRCLAGTARLIKEDGDA